MGIMKELESTSTLFGANAPFIEELYEQYLADPASVSPQWRAYFDELRGGADDVAHAPVVASFVELAKNRRVAGAMVDATTMHKQVLVLRLISKYRTLGMFNADLDPLRQHEADYVADLDLATYGFTDADMDTEFDVGSFKAGPARMRLKDIVTALKDTYTRTLGAEYMYITDTATKRFFQDRLEPIRSRPSYTIEQRKHFLERLTAAETLERYLHTKYVGQKRFSGEGGDTLIPMLDRLIEKGGAAGVQEFVLGMAHRGRLNVLVNILGKMPADLFSEFEGKAAQALPAGDVKYHQGFSSDVSTPGGPVHLTLAFNPSHLEIVNPVVEGSVRARQHRRGDARGDQVLPILIHGDAAIAGQGVNQECLNMAQTRGYYTGGTIHIVINNQIGFTTSDPRDARGTTFCTDIAKMVDAPILHVNGDDPEVALLAVEIALEYRQRFHRDVFIDLVCFRRLGHNEADEPALTQPLMYRRIAQHPGTRKLYADRLIAAGVATSEEADALVKTYRAAMDRGQHTNKTVLSNYKPPFTIDWSPYVGRHWADNVETSVPVKTLQALAVRLTTVPDGFKLHPRAEKVIADRRAMAEGTLPVDWGMGETLAYASLLNDGYGVRLSGEDIGRGTFSHRHSVLHDQNRERWDVGAYVPLQHLKDKQGSCEIIDSVLTEQAVVAFEYGYSTSDPTRLVVWEAQFGDFVNGAQVVIDQFISAGEVKWGRICSLVLLLPHGYEGPGSRAFVGAPRALPSAVRAAQHAGGRAHDAGAGVPHAAAADAAQVPEAADRHDAEEPAAAQGGGVVARGTRERQLPDGHRRDGQAQREERHPRAGLLGQGLLRAARATGANTRSTTSRSSGSSSSIRFPTRTTRARSRSSRRRRKSSGCRKSRRIRAPGTGCARISARTRRRRWCSRMPGARFPHRRRWGMPPSTTPSKNNWWKTRSRPSSSPAKWSSPIDSKV